MLDFIVEELAGDAGWRTVLEAYETQAADVAKTNREADAWVPRLRSIDGVEPSELSRVHGRLIALGFLKFDVSGKGMQYQVSALGRQTLERGIGAQENSGTADAAHEE